MTDDNTMLREAVERQRGGKTDILRVCIENALSELDVYMLKSKNTHANRGRTPARLLAERLIAKGIMP